MNSAVRTTAHLSDTPTGANRAIALPKVIALPLETSSATAVSWAAVLAGAAGAAALSLVLLILGTGLGLSSVSPWTGQGLTASALGASTIAWLTFTQLAAAGMGGYLPLFPGATMRSLLLLFLGVPIPLIILIALFVH